MKFTCGKQDLMKAINTVIKATYSRSVKSILECIHLKAEGEEVVLDAFDTVTAIRSRAFATIEQAGETAIPARLLQEIVGKFPDGEITFYRTEEAGICLKTDNASAFLQEMDASQFPAFPELKGTSFTLTQGELKSLIEGTAFSVYVGEDKPIFTGLLLEAREGQLSMVGIDGVRLAKRSLKRDVAEELRIVIPSKALKDATKLLNEEEEELNIYFNDSACFFTVGNTEIYTRLLDGNYMNYDEIIPKTYKTRVRVLTRQFESSLEMVSVMAKEDSSNLVKMEVFENYVELKSNSEYGTSSVETPVYVEGEMLKIAFNARYMLDVFRAIEDESVYMEFESRLHPCVVKPLEGEGFLYLVVPVNVK